MIGIGKHLTVIWALALTCLSSVARAQNIDFAAIDVQTVKVADGLYVLMGGAAQGNIAVSVGSDEFFSLIPCTARCIRRSWKRWAGSASSRFAI